MTSDATVTNGHTKHESSSKKEWIRLNVGGTTFLTTKQTLCKDPHSFLCRICHDEQLIDSMRDSTGAFLIDRDPNYFSPVLNYLRHGKLIIDKNLLEEGVLAEAEFYQISSLVRLLKIRLKEKDDSSQGNKRTQQVYRVLQSHEDELTQMLSTLSDGWKCEQVINIGSGYSYECNQSEFLILASYQLDDSSSVQSPNKFIDKIQLP
ncbi:hypothetical protein ACHWQZ_G005825 [Mnemiopsis leidyi]